LRLAAENFKHGGDRDHVRTAATMTTIVRTATTSPGSGSVLMARSRRAPGRWAAAGATVAVMLSACGGGVTPPDNTCKVNCQPVETISVAPISPTQGAVLLPTFSSYPLVQVVFSAQAVSNISGQVTNLSWTLNGVSVGTTVSIPAGTYNACVTATAPSGKSANTCFSFIAALPTISGTLKSVKATLSFPVEDFVPQGGAIAVGSYGSFTDTVTVDQSGRWSVSTRWALKDTAFICPIGEGMMPCGKGIPVSRNDFANVGVATGPSVVTIPTGSFANQQVVIDLVKARTFSADSVDGTGLKTAFYVANSNSLVVGDYISYPVPVAFCRSKSNYIVSASDSVKFFFWVEDIHQKFGRQIFKPANEAEVCGLNGAPKNGVLVYFDTTERISHGAAAQWGYTRDYIYGGVVFNEVDVLDRNFVIQHELIHALGFGHTCSWKTIMATCLTPDNVQTTISREDVAYALYMMAVVDEMRKLNTFYSVLNQAR
jgi:hypothetical protein